MLGIIDDKARWIAGFCLLTFLLLILTSCTTAPSSRTYIGPDIRSKTSTRSKESFQTLWEKWTVQIGTQGRNRSLGFLSIPFSGGGGKGPGGGGSGFPLFIDATLMDSMLIETGLRYFAERIEMSPEEEAIFRQKYIDRYNPTDHLLIWCELRTGWAENYLNLDRWILYVEDNEENRCEPVQIIQEPPIYRQKVMEKPLAFQTELGRWTKEVYHKRAMLCFPKFDYYGNPIRSERVLFLKLIFQLIDDKYVREEGKWVFKR